MAILWTMKDLVEIAKKRIENNFDVNIVFSGARGNGKSTGLFKLFSSFQNFKPRIDLVYSRKDVMHLLESRKYHCVMDDEAIRTAYKRNFQEQDQKLLIQMLNMYRDNFNIYGMAIPNFYSLDKDLRSLIKIHVYVIKRGLAAVHIINDDNLYSDDPWDIKHNQRIEEGWAKAKAKNPNFRPKYTKLTTFRGYLKYGDLTKKQKRIYLELKETKRKKVYDTETNGDNNSEQQDENQRLISLLREGRITRDQLFSIALAKNIQFSSLMDKLNKILRDEGSKDRVVRLIRLAENPNNKFKHSNFVKMPQI